MGKLLSCLDENETKIDNSSRSRIYGIQNGGEIHDVERTNSRIWFKISRYYNQAAAKYKMSFSWGFKDRICRKNFSCSSFCPFVA